MDVTGLVRYWQERHKKGVYSSEKSFYFELRARRSGESPGLGRRTLHTCLGTSICALTVMFFEAEDLLLAVERLLSRLSRGMISWVWLTNEPEVVAGKSTAATAVFLFLGVPLRCSVYKLAHMVLPGPLRASVSTLAYSPAWFIELLEGYDEVDLWLTRREEQLSACWSTLELQQGWKLECSPPLSLLSRSSSSSSPTTGELGAEDISDKSVRREALREISYNSRVQ